VFVAAQTTVLTRRCLQSGFVPQRFSFGGYMSSRWAFDAVMNFDFSLPGAPNWPALNLPFANTR
jgi:hypothetical protein